MPTYDYRCTDCGREIEVVHGIHGSGPETCQSCGSAMRKALSTPAIHFKGSGWAKKDAKSAAAAKTPNGSAESKGGTPSGKDDKTPASSDQKDSGDSSGEASSSKADSSKADSSTAGKAATGSKAD